MSLDFIRRYMQKKTISVTDNNKSLRNKSLNQSVSYEIIFTMFTDYVISMAAENFILIWPLP